MKYFLESIDDVASSLFEEWKHIGVWCFHGEMGSGKTTLIKSICQQIGVIDTMSSPSFAIINEYQTTSDQIIYHFDFYRIKSEKEVENIGTDEYFDSGNLCLIEWPEMIESHLPDNYLEINIKLVGENQRELTVTPHVGEH